MILANWQGRIYALQGNYFPHNVYPKDYPELQEQLKPLRTYPVEVRDSEVWEDLG